MTYGPFVAVLLIFGEFDGFLNAGNVNLLLSLKGRRRWRTTLKMLWTFFELVETAVSISDVQLWVAAGVLGWHRGGWRETQAAAFVLPTFFTFFTRRLLACEGRGPFETNRVFVGSADEALLFG